MVVSVRGIFEMAKAHWPATSETQGVGWEMEYYNVVGTLSVAFVFHAEKEREGAGRAGDEEEGLANGGRERGGERGGEGGDGGGCRGGETFGEECFDAMIAILGGGIESEDFLIGAVEVELARGEAFHEDRIGFGGGHEVGLHGDFLIEQGEGGLVVVAVGFGVFEVFPGGGDDHAGEEDETEEEKGPGNGADGEDKGDPDE